MLEAIFPYGAPGKGRGINLGSTCLMTIASSVWTPIKASVSGCNDMQAQVGKASMEENLLV